MGQMRRGGGKAEEHPKELCSYYPCLNTGNICFKILMMSTEVTYQMPMHHSPSPPLGKSQSFRTQTGFAEGPTVWGGP